LSDDQRGHRTFLSVACILVLLSSAASHALAQDDAKAPAASSGKSTKEKWRPKDGFYGTRDKDDTLGFCREADGVSVVLAKKRIVGYEWSCDITKVTDTETDAIRLDLSCDNYNLAEALKLPEDHEFREIMLLKRIDEMTISAQRTTNGKFGQRWQASYCPGEQQRLAAGEKPTPWIPRDGAYASLGADFDDRCLKAPDAIIDFARKSISGANECDIYSYNDALMIAPHMTLVCNDTHSKKGLVQRTIDGGIMFGPPGFEVLNLSRIDDNTISLQKTHNGQSSQPANNVSYCGDEAQRHYVEQQAGK